MALPAIPAIFDVSNIRQQWETLSGLPGGKALFSRAIGFMAPYSGTIGATVLELGPGQSKVEMRESRKVRNHLRSIHAAALFNLAELAGNLALIAAMPTDARMIPVGLSIEYLKKARGRIVATGEAPAVPTSERKEYEASVRIHDEQGNEVARARLRTLVGPKGD